MQDLKKQLLKAGLVDKKTARKARAEQRKARKKKGSHQEQAEQAQGREERHRQRQQEQARKVKEEQDRRNAEAARREARARHRDLIRGAALEDVQGDGRPFYFVGGDNKIRRFYPKGPIAAGLSDGRFAIVALEGEQPDHALVPAATATRLEGEAPELILFWNKPGSEEDDGLPTYGSGR